MTLSPYDARTLAIRAGRTHNDTALAPVLWASSTFVANSFDQAKQFAADITEPKFYGRNSNPTVVDFENAMAELEGAEASRAFASGMGAVSAVVLGLCSAGDHIVAQSHIYSHTTLLLQAVCPRFGIDVSFVDGADTGAFEAAVIPGKTTLVLAETPANPKLALVDLEALGAIKGPMTVVDSTLATPIMQRPLDYGVDLVLHSATKAIAGHNDAILGVVSGSEELMSWLRGFAVLHGAVASPFDALNGLRGIRTLPIRVQQQCATATRLAEALQQHRAVRSVHYPGLESHPQYQLAQRQLDLSGGLVTFDLRGGLQAAITCINRLRLIQRATSLGGPETLVTHPASTTHAALLPEELAAADINGGTLRISCGLEHADDLLSDLTQALAPCI
ncbi:MAG: aminotransferase class I/II-fold pyridoxal phosphate-dependent enzyme [Acidimicrobiia bacterium]|nr:aminotransferase class I/II-fold pyridoxal phosphate-dependent enzyme [Acidimicrobiia bacterium]MCY4458716.1 aminotransferase class I/II-fold pyridoxal phosphate-dependent enzyme [Acidimicrobiaceae bacterium]